MFVIPELSHRIELIRHLYTTAEKAIEGICSDPETSDKFDLGCHNTEFLQLEMEWWYHLFDKLACKPLCL